MIKFHLKLVGNNCASNLRCASYMLFLVVGIFIVPTSLLATPKNSKESLDQLRHRIEVIQKEINSKEIKKLEAADALQESESAISSTNRRLVLLSQEKRRIEVSFKQVRMQYGDIKAGIGELQLQLNKLLYHQYLESPQNYIRLLLNQQDPNQIARDLYYMNRLSHARSESIDALQIQLVEFKKLTQRLHKKREEVKTILAEQSNQKKLLEQEETKRRNLLSRISDQIAQQRQDIDKLKRDEKRLSALTVKINELVADQNSHRPLYNNKVPNAAIQGRLFASLKGHLNLPVRGELVGRFDGPRSDKAITWKGLFIKSSDGSAVKAIADGQVVFADWLRGFGNLMIVDHGDNYMSLYGNNKAIYKQVGDVIRGGETIAIVGSSGGNLDSGLYFELRYKGKPFDPMKWIKIE